MSWTSVTELHSQVQKLWDKGTLLAALLPHASSQNAEQPPALFPLRLRLRGPSSQELTDRFDEVRPWMAAVRASASSPGWRVVWRNLNHRVLGQNQMPESVWLDTLDDALAVLGQQPQAQRFTALVQTTVATFPNDLALHRWLAQNPLKVLALTSEWERLLAIVGWLRAHPHPGIYLRQLSVQAQTGTVSGIDSKFIELHRGVLAELLDLMLPPAAIDPRFSGAAQFAKRYGFRDKPLRVRFRLLDPAWNPVGQGVDQDITLTQAAFERLPETLGRAVQRVFITENEINFLAFPSVPASVVLFGAGYGFESLGGVDWLHACPVHYWGDIDTHGFAILDQLRASVPHAHSLLMDHATFMTHRAHWGEEPQPSSRDLPRLNAAETALFDDLRYRRIPLELNAYPKLRLEQERVGYECLQQALAALP